MKYCSQCGHANEDDALFCVKDGCKLGEPIDGSQEDKSKKQICTKCGFENNEDVKFCGKCGNVLKKKKKRFFVRIVQIVLMVLIFIVIGYALKNGVKLINKQESYYLELVSNHSYNISSEGGTIMFKINTNADWLTKDDFIIGIYGRAVGDVTFVDERNFMVKLGRNEYDENIYPVIYISLSETGSINFLDYIGVKIEEDVDYEEDDKMGDRIEFQQNKQ